jgi:hypothetical protein
MGGILKKYIWKFTRTQLFILSILVLITIFIFAIDIFLLFENNDIKIFSSPTNEITSTLSINKTPIEFSTSSHQITQTGPTDLLTTALPPVLTPTKESIIQTPSSNPIITSAAPTPPPPQFFTNEWEDNTNNWRWFSTSGNDNLWDVYNEAGVLVFSLLGKDTNAYFIYKPWDYEKVQISTRIEVRSKTKSSTVIICNYSEAVGWYEFNIGTDGIWDVRLHDTLGKTGYLLLINGGSLAIQTGEGINEYTATCDGNNLRLSINGTEVLDFTDQIMKYKQGKIGLGVISFSEVPILIESDWVKISQP